MMLNPENSTVFITNNTSPSTADTIKPDPISRGIDIKPPQCYKCGKTDLFKFHKLTDGHIYCSKCTEELANETIKKEQMKEFLDSCIPDELKDK